MRRLGRPAITALLIFAAVTTPGMAAEAESSASRQHTFDLKPLVIDSNDGTGSTVGAEFILKGVLLESSKPEAQPSGDSTTPGDFEPVEQTQVKQYSVDYNIEGVATADAERNPLNYIDALINADMLWNVNSCTLLGGAFIRYETDQSQDNRQSEYGLGGTVTKPDLFKKNDEFAFDLRFGEVDPKKDEVRQAALGTPSLDKFYRWDAELLYMLPLTSDGALRDLEFNYRYYLEDDPPAAIKAADLDVHRMATVRLGLKGGLFIAYSRGKLPFDQESDRIYAIGFSYKLY